MKPSAVKRPPSFRQQALWILLPVVALTLAGGWALWQDRRLVEQEARDRATQVLRSARNRLTNRLPAALADPARYVSPDRPDPPPRGAVPFRSRWDAAGRLVQPPDFPDPPAPAVWWQQLDPGQRSAWADLAGAATPVTPTATPRSALTNSPAPAPATAIATVARFLAARDRFTAEPGSATAAEMFMLARRHPGVTSAGGLPLHTLATAALLSHQETGVLQALLLENLADSVRKFPSALTPVLLRRAREVWRQSIPERLDELADLEQLWKQQMLVRQLARGFVRRAAAGDAAGTRWLGPAGESWLAVFGPDNAPHGTNAPPPPDQQGRFACWLPESAVAGALTSTLASLTNDWPAYAGLEVEVAGRPMTLPSLPSPNPPADEGTTAFIQLATADLAVERLALGSGANPSKPSAPPPADALRLPAPLPIRLRVNLTDPARLYARQARRAGLFGGLILAAALAALAGLRGAQRAFRQQCRLAELKSNFVSSVSHELRAPIASVRLLAESLERGKITDAAKRQDYFRLIGQECRRLSGLIENVLDFSRIDQNRQRYEFEPTDLAALVRETVRLMEPCAGERQVPLGCETPRAPVEIAADGRALQQALVNLIDNALKHSPAGKPVRVTLTTSEAGVRLSVADQGPGIAAEDRERIFEPFFRRGSELRRETPGVGIGLSIVRHVITAHGGQVHVTDPPGPGAVFTIELPDHPTPAAQTKDP